MYVGKNCVLVRSVAIQTKRQGVREFHVGVPLDVRILMDVHENTCMLFGVCNSSCPDVSLDTLEEGLNVFAV
jgi:hypothetical protein